MADNQRLYINTMRGFAIFLMLWGHCIQFFSTDAFDFFADAVFKTIYSFHMPLFMLISGYLFYYSFQKRTLPELLIHRTQSMLQPILMMSIVFFFLLHIPRALLRGDWKEVFSGLWFSWAAGPFLWFLWSVLACSLALSIACKTSKHRWIHAALILFGFLFVGLFPNAELNVFMYPYFVGGFLFCKYQSRLLPVWSKARYLAIPVFPVLLYFMRKEDYIYTSGLCGTEGLLLHMPVNLFRWCIGFFGSITVLTIGDLLFRIPSVHRLRGVTALAKLGSKSLQIYAISVIILSHVAPYVYSLFCQKVGQNILITNHWLYDLLITPLLAVAIAALLWIFTHFLEKYKLSKILFGR